MKIAAIVLAAGASRRMGRDKALLPWPADSDKTLLEAILDRAFQVTPYRFVVAGENFEDIKFLVRDMSTPVFHNEKSYKGMFRSLQCGIFGAFAHQADAALVFHVDRPPAKIETLHKLVNTFSQEASDKPAVFVASHKGQHGHPFLMNAAMMHIFERAPLDSNARDLMHASGTVKYVECDDVAVITNINLPEDYQRAAALGGV